MVINELKQTCPRCEGRGRLPGLEKMGIPQINFTGLCPTCQGRGFTLTQLGDEVLELLKPFVLDWLREERQGAPPTPASGQALGGGSSRGKGAGNGPEKETEKGTVKSGGMGTQKSDAKGPIA